MIRLKQLTSSMVSLEDLTLDTEAQQKEGICRITCLSRISEQKLIFGTK